MASPLVYQETIFIGNEDGTFYAINAVNSDLKWKHETEGIIQAKATSIDGNIYSVSVTE